MKTLDKKYPQYITIAIATKRHSKFATVVVVDKITDWLVNVVTIHADTGMIVEDVGVNRNELSNYLGWLRKCGYRTLCRRITNMK